MRLLSFAFIIGLVAPMGCHRDTPPEPAQYAVPVAVEPYVQHLRDEAGKRGMTLVIDNLIVQFGTTQGEDICGQCLLETGKTPRIILNPNAYCWQSASAEEREGLVFHELGHCLLKRVHRTDRFVNQAYASLMNPDDAGVYAACRYPIGDDVCDKRPRRPYYVDELFNADTPVPAWGK